MILGRLFGARTIMTSFLIWLILFWYFTILWNYVENETILDLLYQIMQKKIPIPIFKFILIHFNEEVHSLLRTIFGETLGNLDLDLDCNCVKWHLMWYRVEDKKDFIIMQDCISLSKNSYGRPNRWSKPGLV